MNSFPSELRHNRLSDRWSLIAAGRGKRPHQFSDAPQGPPKRDPFETKNIPPSDIVAVLPEQELPPGVLPEDWQVLSMKNAFPFVSADHEPTRTHGAVRDGYGFHEIVVHSPDADKNIEDFPTEQTARILEMFVKRYSALARHKHIKHVQVFTNRGSTAGASVIHPHSQIVALPVVPPYVNQVMRVSAAHRDSAGSELIEDELFNERESGQRIIADLEHFTAYAPFAPRVNYQIRIAPKEHVSHFEDLTPEARLDLAALLGNLYRALNTVSGTPDYNAFVRTPPTSSSVPKAFRWHIDIIPHLATPGGLEISTGLDVITIPPEDSAADLRKAL